MTRESPFLQIVPGAGRNGDFLMKNKKLEMRNGAKNGTQAAQNRA
jgi:hypothetical protein